MHASPRTHEEARTVKGKRYDTYQEAASAMGFSSNGNGHLKRGRGEAAACDRDAALGGNVFLSSMPEFILKRVYGRRPRAMRTPSQRSTGAAHDDRDRAQLAQRSA